MKQWWTVVAVGVAVFVAGLDMSITNVALPTLAREFGVGPNGVVWVVLAYNLPLVALLLPLGRWVDVLDKRGAFLVAVLGFAMASAVWAYAGSGVGGMRASLYAMLAAAVLAVVAAWIGSSAPGRPPAQPAVKEEVG